VVDVWSRGDAVAVGRGDLGLVVVNAGDEPLATVLVTHLPDGDYCDVLTDTSDDCAATRVEDGRVSVDVPAQSARAWHVGRTG
jgi:alpha-amylase